MGFLAIVLPIISTGLANSVNAAFSGMLSELNEAAKSVIEREMGDPENSMKLSALHETGLLSPETENWLRNCTFECQSINITVSPKYWNQPRSGLAAALRT